MYKVLKHMCAAIVPLIKPFDKILQIKDELNLLGLLNKVIVLYCLVTSCCRLLIISS